MSKPLDFDLRIFWTSPPAEWRTSGFVIRVQDTIRAVAEVSDLFEKLVPLDTKAKRFKRDFRDLDEEDLIALAKTNTTTYALWNGRASLLMSMGNSGGPGRLILNPIVQIWDDRPHVRSILGAAISALDAESAYVVALSSDGGEPRQFQWHCLLEWRRDDASLPTLVWSSPQPPDLREAFAGGELLLWDTPAPAIQQSFRPTV